MPLIKAKYNGYCRETGRKFLAGTKVFYKGYINACFCKHSDAYKQYVKIMKEAGVDPKGTKTAQSYQ